MLAAHHNILATATTPSNSAILLVALFGSVARGDSTPESDIDLLFVTRENRLRQVTRGNVTVYHYPWRYLQHSARIGELFACHLVREAKALFDPCNRLRALGQQFQYKKAYCDDIRAASDLGWFLGHHGLSIRSDVAAKRIAWCVRTILIARSVEAGGPIFSCDGLSYFANSLGVERLIADRRSGSVSRERLEDLTKFLEEFGTPDPGDEVSSPESYLRQFRITANKFALQTLLNAGPSIDYGVPDLPPELPTVDQQSLRSRLFRAHISTPREDLVILTSSMRTPTAAQVEKVAIRLTSNDIVVEAESRPARGKPTRYPHLAA